MTETSLQDMKRLRKKSAAPDSPLLNAHEQETVLSYAEAFAALTAPGAPFELTTDAHGVRWFARRPPDLTHLLDAVGRFGDREAIVYGESVNWSYREFVGCVRRCAGGLRRLAEPGARLAILGANHPRGAEAAVIGESHGDLGEQVCALVRLREGAVIEPGDLRAWVAETLAAFKAPDRIEFSPVDLPRNAAGKLLKPAIRQHFCES